MTAEPIDIYYSFSGHETFPLRYAWLPKAVQKLKDYPDLFLRDDALVVLGVGKNMVHAIRHWSQAFGMIDIERGGRDQISPLGTKLLTPEGWDPYLEDPGTLWLLHWQLASRPVKASTWHLAFTRWRRESFTRAELVEWLLRITDNLPSVRATRSSIKRDVDVFIRTYVPSTVTATRPLEETFDSPLVELGLIKEIEKDTYGFVRGPKLMLPDKIFVFALLDYWREAAPHQQTLSFEVVLHGKGSPGAAFKLSENALVERLERLPPWTGIRFDDTAGMRQLLKQPSVTTLPLDALERYYVPEKRGNVQ
ncbi:MAG: DUF4007 family protein [Deinococcota bacterium]|nr:DUF4007 family protein [Deinococcota bacterium]